MFEGAALENPLNSSRQFSTPCSAARFRSFTTFIFIECPQNLQLRRLTNNRLCHLLLRLIDSNMVSSDVARQLGMRSVAWQQSYSNLYSCFAVQMAIDTAASCSFSFFSPPFCPPFFKNSDDFERRCREGDL